MSKDMYLRDMTTSGDFLANKIVHFGDVATNKLNGVTLSSLKNRDMILLLL